ncbi:MFS transporter [Streptomyces sp. NBC_00264]|uniref:MFS transporter n=2 Tax=unclassified Streptomyces TaxID=2593676 RepID=UPI0022594E13|nr:MULTISPECIES: MFS transporter [unclassified Streptomyces]WSG51414.1 MFS transporter [Streptomyces sp. NBC_01732]WSX02071.1 MFS transporter [Streptomyces sp. NBC_00987]MCX4396026.1 MFS transporter [Streptomyces sp. NBC_01767]MCX5101340.1 MFS transporter [Streptomyces sp. NBC_00439]MCX5160862.1 MFS transporter [Streptomyces sp. NBC_00305]
MTTAEPGPGHGAAKSTGMRGSDSGGSTRTAAPAREDTGAADASAPRTGPSRRARAERLLRHPVTIATAAAAVTHLLWVLFFANSGGDLAAQDAWAEFVGRHPGTAYNLAWYGGMHPVSYSVVSPYLMSLLGVRTTMMIAGTVSAALTALILVRVRAVRNPLACSLAGAFAYLCNALSGRVTFGLGMMFAVGATAAVFCWPYRWRYKRWAKAAVAAPLAGLATASSPVAGLFLGVVAAALFLNKRRPGAYALGLAPVAVVALSAWLFPFSGTQPMSVATLSLPFIFSVLVFVLVPRDWKTVRTAAAVYGVGTLLTYFIDSQIGSNITRMAMLFAGVVFLAALPYTAPRSRRWYALIIAFTGLNFWIGFKSVDDIVRTAPTASWARELAPLVNELQQVGAERGRVEVVPASSHREASALAPYVNLARGWNRQADMKRNPLFYDDTLDSANYRQWLDRWAVHYVVLPTGTPDSNGAVQEAQLVDGGLPYLKPVWSDANWRLFEVDGPVPLADPPATVDRAEAGELTIHVKTPGRILIRIPYSRWLAVVDSEGRGVERPQETEASKQRTDENTPRTFVNTNGCLFKVEEDADGDEWTELLAPRPGVYRLAAPYQLSPGTPCPEELR